MKPAEGIKGPGIDPGAVTFEAELPDCVAIKSESDKKAFDAFVGSIIHAAHQNAMRHLSECLVECRRRLNLL